ncbi:MAG: hypothetical protein ABJH98_03390 [Reichenbachiella sp.]|uniref:hypothetical protein n=1 Tax=Reichenbachiella sp. TaxID=2184521 RepID=UPI0032988722
MDDNLDKLMSGFENQSFNLDPTILFAELIAGSIRNHEILKEVLGQQLELKELIKGTPNDIDEVVEQKYSAIMDKMKETIEKRYYEVIQRATKD